MVLPYPPTANLYWRVWRGRPVKSPAARLYQLAVKTQLLGRRLKPLKGPVEVTFDVYRPRRRGDLDNALKVSLDALRGFAFVDDDQVVDIHARRFDDAADPRLVVTVRERSA
jgi:crossover junction endodeoxyribonuclease RusA